jgi:hypothetical protein
MAVSAAHAAVTVDNITAGDIAGAAMAVGVALIGDSCGAGTLIGGVTGTSAASMSKKVCTFTACSVSPSSEPSVGSVVASWSAVVN